MNVVFFGTSAFGLPALDALKRSSHKILAVVTQPDKPSGRNLEPKPSVVKQWASTGHSIQTWEFSKGMEEAITKELELLKPDVFVVISFGHLLKKRLLDIPKIAPLNVHASLLPRWRGASPMQSVILAGDKESGVGVMRMVEALDAGDVLLEKRLKLEAAETILTLEPKLAALGASALMEALDILEKGNARWVPQDAARATLCVKIKKEDGRMKWTDPAEMLDRKARAFLAWPGSFAFFNEKRLIVKRCRVETGPGGVPGTVLEAGAGGIRVATAKGTLVLEEIQQEGRKAMPAADFLKGFPLKAGDNLS